MKQALARLLPYSGPAINVLAIILTARILGFELGIARAVATIGSSIAIGLSMAFLFRKEEKARAASFVLQEEKPPRPFWQTIVFLATLVAILIFATWGKGEGIFGQIYTFKWKLVFLAFLFLLIELRFLFKMNFF
ncbi:hypothetical protein [Thermodesulfatator indicus]